MNKPKINEKGITLIALVITIIVLLILAGVAINMAIDSDGLFGKANEAVEGWNTAVRNEQIAITNLLEIANGVGGTTGGGDEPPTLPASWDSTKVSAVVEEGTRKAPIPVGFVASQITAGEDGKGAENTISVGLVIYQGDAPVTGEAGSEAHNTAMTTRNQYVWIPVDDINQMVMCKSNTGTSICNLVLQADGTLKCETHNSTELCGRLYGTSSSTTDTSTPKTYTTSMNFTDRTQTWYDIGYCEPDVLGSSYDNDANTGNLATFTTQMTNDFVNMATSVAKYGGFYVSRYEAGENGASLKNQVVITTASSDSTVRKGLSNWYGLYNAVRKEIAVGESTMQSHMIYGSQYDQIINFIGSEAQTGHTDRQLTTQGLTGANGNDIMKNIYDLEGNNYEWTAQAGTGGRVNRGGNYVFANNGNFYPASHRSNYNPTGTNDRSTTRPSLYL